MGCALKTGGVFLQLLTIPMELLTILFLCLWFNFLLFFQFLFFLALLVAGGTSFTLGSGPFVFPVALDLVSVFYWLSIDWIGCCCLANSWFGFFFDLGKWFQMCLCCFSTFFCIKLICCCRVSTSSLSCDSRSCWLFLCSSRSFLWFLIQSHCKFISSFSVLWATTLHSWS